jgi:hypothetical protein
LIIELSSMRNFVDFGHLIQYMCCTSHKMEAVKLGRGELVWKNRSTLWYILSLLCPVCVGVQFCEYVCTAEKAKLGLKWQVHLEICYLVIVQVFLCKHVNMFVLLSRAKLGEELHQDHRSVLANSRMLLYPVRKNRILGCWEDKPLDYGQGHTGRKRPRLWLDLFLC